MAHRPDRPPFLMGRNYVESIVYTLTYTAFTMRLERGARTLSWLVEELERQLCGLARAVPQLRVIYHGHVRETLREYFPDHPLPELGPKCIVHPTILEWIEKNSESILGADLSIYPETEVKLKARELADEIVFQSVMGALYEAGVVSHA